MSSGRHWERVPLASVALGWTTRGRAAGQRDNPGSHAHVGISSARAMSSLVSTSSVGGTGQVQYHQT
jgi:hypothetical protein